MLKVSIPVLALLVPVPWSRNMPPPMTCMLKIEKIHLHRLFIVSGTGIFFASYYSVVNVCFVFIHYGNAAGISHEHALHFVSGTGMDYCSFVRYGYQVQVVDSIACAVPCIVINSCLSRKSYTKGCNFQSGKTEGIYKYVCYLSQPASAPQHFTFGNNTVRPTYDLFTFDPTTTWRTRLHASRTKIVKLQLHSTLYTIQDTVQ